MDEYIPIPERVVDKPFLMPIEDIFSIQGRGTVVTGRIEKGICKVGEEMEIVGFRGYTQNSCHRRGNVQEVARRRAARAITWAYCCAVLKKTTWNAGRSSPSPAVHQAVTRSFKGEVYVLIEGRRRTPHPVFQRLSAAILLPHHGRDGRGEVAGRYGNGHAGRQRSGRPWN